MTGSTAEGGAREPDTRAIDSVMRAVDFVERALGRDIGLSDMAEAARYSPFYFSRLFFQATGHSPYDYLMRRRVAVAASAMETRGASLIDIALDCGFSSPDTFARAFRRCFGRAPSDARRSGSFPRALSRTRITREFAEEALVRPFGPPEAVDAEASIVDGVDRHDAKDSQWIEIAQRYDDLAPLRAFSGLVRGGGKGPPLAYPASSAGLPAGKRARFSIGPGNGRLAFLLEYAYRCWLPSAGLGLPDFDVVEWEGGSPRWLSLHLGPCGPVPPQPRTSLTAERAAS